MCVSQRRPPTCLWSDGSPKFITIVLSVHQIVAITVLQKANQTQPLKNQQLFLMRKRKVEGRGRGKERKRMRKKERGRERGFTSNFPFPLSLPLSFFLILFLSFPLPLPSTLRLRIKISLFALSLQQLFFENEAFLIKRFFSTLEVSWFCGLVRRRFKI